MATESPGSLLPQLDLAAVAKNPELLSMIDTVVKLKPPETPEERAERLRLKAINTYYGLAKEAIILLSFLILAIIIGYICFGIITAPATPANQEAQKWAMSIISGAASGLLGFLVGKSARGSSE